MIAAPTLVLCGDDDIASKQTQANQSSGGRAEQLRDPVADGSGYSHVASTDKTKRYGRIQLAA